MIKKIYQLILDTYPFLTKAEKADFIKQSKTILNKKLSFKAIEEMLNILSNGHAYIYPKRSTYTIRRISHKLIKDILYIKIPAWSGNLGGKDQNLINLCVNEKNKYKTIIIDVRENNGGNSSIAHKFAGIFFKKDVIYGKIIRKNKKGILEEKPMTLQANGKIYLDKKIVILISKRCFSSNELFITPFKISKRALLIGERTRGGSGNPIKEEIVINGKNYIVGIPRWRFFLKGKSRPIEETAIEPDIYFQSHNFEDIIRFIENLKNN